jgi:hypothetical protein
MGFFSQSEKGNPGCNGANTEIRVQGSVVRLQRPDLSGFFERGQNLRAQLAYVPCSEGQDEVAFMG